MQYFSTIAMFIITSFLGISWITHIVHCLLTAKYLLLLVGAFVFPVGIIHGAGIILGVQW